MPKVTIYSRTTCGPCRTVKAWLNYKKIAYTEKNLDDHPEFATELAQFGAMTVPLTVIGDATILGPNIGAISERLGLR